MREAIFLLKITLTRGAASGQQKKSTKKLILEVNDAQK